MMPQGPECPRCHHQGVRTPGFTWWGGMLGPKIIKHVKCDRCAYSFNPETGQPITGAIIAYSVVVGVIALLFVFALTRM